MLMSKLHRVSPPPAFVRWLQLLFATAKAHVLAWPALVRGSLRIPNRSRSAPFRGRRSNDFAPTQVMKRMDDGVDERWFSAGTGVEVSEEDLETLPAELRDALLGDRRRARARAESAAAA